MELTLENFHEVKGLVQRTVMCDTCPGRHFNKQSTGKPHRCHKYPDKICATKSGDIYLDFIPQKEL